MIFLISLLRVKRNLTPQQNNFMKYLFLLCVFFIINSCSIIYKSGNSSTYTIKRRNKVFRFSPKIVYFDIDYTKIDELKTEDSIIYKKIKLESEFQKILKLYNNKNKIRYTFCTSGTTINIPLNVGDSIESNVFMPDLFFSTINLLNLCSNHKHDIINKKRTYIYSYQKDTLIPFYSLNDFCVKLKIETKNTQYYPSFIYIDKKSGIPIYYQYPFCSIDSFSDNILVNYLSTYYSTRKKVFFLNSKKYCW